MTIKSKRPPAQSINAADLHEFVRPKALAGSFRIYGPHTINVIMEQGLAEPIRVTRFSSRYLERVIWRRSVKEIRSEDSEFYLINFVERGFCRIHHSNGACDINQGQFFIQRGDDPCYVEMFADHAHSYETTQVIVPTHLAAHRLHSKDYRGKAILSASGNGSAALGIAKILHECSNTICDNTKNDLIELFVNACIGSLEDKRNHGAAPTVRSRVDEIIDFIERNAHRKAFSVAHVAEKFSVSRRYVSLLLKSRSLSFPQLVRKSRIRMAERLLQPDHVDQSLSIKEISQLTGFKTVQHFCEVFKLINDCSPRQWAGRRAVSAREGSTCLEDLTAGRPTA